MRFDSVLLFCLILMSLNFGYSQDQNYLLKNVQKIGIGGTPSVLISDNCYLAPIVTDNENNTIVGFDFKNEILTITHMSFLDNEFVSDYDNEEIIFNILNKDNSTIGFISDPTHIINYPSFENELEKKGHSVIKDSNFGRNSNLDEFDVIVVNLQSTPNIEDYNNLISYMKTPNKKTILIGMGWVWKYYWSEWSNGDPDKYPLNILLEDFNYQFSYDKYGSTISLKLFPNTFDFYENISKECIYEITNSPFLTYDSDNDSYSDIIEVFASTDFNNNDSFPIDTDNDGIFNYLDNDDDDDSYNDEIDAFPLDKNEWSDLDDDNLGDNEDLDDDNDTVNDVNDNCPTKYNPEQTDSDQDGIGDFCDRSSNQSSNSLEKGYVIKNTNGALPTSYNFIEYVFPEPDDIGVCDGVINTSAQLKNIYFSQTHRLSKDHPFFFLIGERPALIELRITGSGDSPEVKLKGYINGVEIGDLCLSKPNTLPLNFDEQNENFEDLFYVTIPKNWMKEGLSLKLEFNNEEIILDEKELKVGPYTEMNLVQVNLDFLDYNTGQLKEIIDDFIEEVASAIPASVIRFGKFPIKISFPEIISSNGKEKLVLLKDSKGVGLNDISGGDLSAIGNRFVRNLHKSTNDYSSTIYFGNTLNLPAGGWGGDKSFTSSDYSDVFIHELGHALSLPHWGTTYGKDLSELSSFDFLYPFGGDPVNYSSGAGETTGKGGGRGNSFNYIQYLNEFVSPICGESNGRGVEGTESSDAMQRNNFCLEIRPKSGAGPWDGFGAFSSHAINRYLIGFSEAYRGQINYRGAQENFQFNIQNGTPSIKLSNNKRAYKRSYSQPKPSIYESKIITREEKLNQEVYLIYGSIHPKQDQANIIYKPIRYNGTLQEVIDPTNPEIFNNLKTDQLYKTIFNEPKDILLKVTYQNGDVLHLINPNNSFKRDNQYNGSTTVFRDDISYFSLTVPANSNIEKVELFDRPFLIGGDNDKRLGNIMDESQNITAENFMENAEFKAIYSAIDFDEDGVLNQFDNCPNTPIGSVVDINGCEIFTLPSNNYDVKVTSATCVGSQNGSVSVTARNQQYIYNVSITDQNNFKLNSDNSFNTNITGLGAGAYNICFTIEGQANYQECFSISISEPPPLSTSAKVDLFTKSVNLSLNGSNNYNINLNGQIINTSKSNVSLDLKAGMNYISISTDLDCQGVYFEEIFVSEDVLAYPNPTDGMVQLYIGGYDKNITLNIFAFNGQKVISKTFEVPSNRVIKADLSSYPSGLYFFALDSETVKITHKIIKD